MTDEKNNIIAITPKKPLPIEEKNLSEQLQSIFPDVNEKTKEESETFKEKIEDINEIISK